MDRVIIMGKWNQNGEGYADSTAVTAIKRVSEEEKAAMAAGLGRQITGRRNKAAGEAFERRLSNACEFYLRKGWAHIEKTPEPFHITGKDTNGVVRGYYEKKGQPDYKGILCDGTGIMFEAKHTDSLRINQRVITDTQWKNLDIYEKFGARCYVMVSLGLEKFYRVPWSVWKQMKGLFGHKFMTERELAPYKLQEKQCTILILEGVELKDENTENRACSKAEQN